MSAVPGPRGVWLLGNVFDALRHGRHGVMMMWSRRYPEGFGKIFFGARSFLVTEDPAIARSVLQNALPIQDSTEVDQLPLSDRYSSRSEP